ncbi:Chorismatase [compost metagenome]
MGRVPAACALGLAGGPLSIAFLAGSTPAVPIENPRQVSAYHYPAEYGPRSPTFSRVAMVYPPGQELLFISGTASIVGHQSVHLDDVVAQTRESLDNIEAVLAEAQRLSPQGFFALADLSYRVYIRHAADLGAVMAVMAGRVASAETLYLQADVCRSELLVEIEAQGLRVVQAA